MRTLAEYYTLCVISRLQTLLQQSQLRMSIENIFMQFRQHLQTSVDVINDVTNEKTRHRSQSKACTYFSNHILPISITKFMLIRALNLKHFQKSPT